MLHWTLGTSSKRVAKRRCILLVDPAPPTREAVAQFLKSAGGAYDVVAVANAEATPSSKPIDLAILNIGSARVDDSGVRAEIEYLRARFADTPLALLADLEDITEITKALRVGVRAYIPSHLSSTVTLAGLRIVLAGGIFVPAEPTANASLSRSVLQFDESAQKPPPGRDPECAKPLLDLTLREKDVVQFLRQGKTNREIARALSMAESTVKVHIRNIMRKLNATGRTEIVCIADAQLSLIQEHVG